MDREAREHLGEVRARASRLTHEQLLDRIEEAKAAGELSPAQSDDMSEGQPAFNSV